MNTNSYFKEVYRQDLKIFGTPLWWLIFRCLPTLLMVSLILLLFSASAARGETFMRDKALKEGESSARMLLQRAGSQGYVRAVLQESSVHFDISGLVATVRVKQNFRNDTDDFVEALYVFPLPESGAVRYMEMQVGERRVIGKIREKAEAKKLYEQARKTGKKASLVSQQRSNLFTNRVANIAPGEAITVVLEYVQSVAYDAGEFSIRFPLTVTPRYMPGQTLQTGDVDTELSLWLGSQGGWALPTDQVPDAHTISPLLSRASGSDLRPTNPVSLTATLDMGMPLANVEAAYHDIALSRRAGIYSIALANGVSEMNRDFLLSWRPVAGSEPQAALFTEEVDGEHYGLLMVLPPAAEVAQASISREIVFVVDTSGSMGGASIEQAKASLTMALDQLGSTDRFNIIEFNSAYSRLYRTAVPATRHHLARAREFVRLLRASGGTEMLPALRAALVPFADPDLVRNVLAVRQVVFITDGAVGNESALFSEVAQHLGDTRLFTVGIGSAPNSYFMRKAAEVGRGSHTYIGKIEEVGSKMAALFEKLSKPAAVNVDIQWSSTVEAWPQRVPDLYYGEPLTVAVKFSSAPSLGSIEVSGELAGASWARSISLAELSGEPAGHQGVATLWARRKIGGLLDRRLAGASEDETKAAVLPLALAHQLLSPYTSFVAIEEPISRPVGTELKQKAVANTRPQGQSGQGFAYPRTATSGPAKLWFGGFALFLSLLLHLLRRPEVDCDASA